MAATLAALASRFGIESLVAKSLRPKPYSEMIIPERYMRDLLNEMRRNYSLQSGVLYRNILRWLDSKHHALVKATIPPPGHPLTADEIEELRDLVRGHFLLGAGIGANVLDLFDQYGLTPPEWGFMLTAIQDAFMAGRINVGTDFGQTIDELRKEMLRLPMSRVDTLALRQSQLNTRMYLRKIGETTADDIARTVSEHEARQVSGVINSYLRGDLSETLYDPVGGSTLTPEEHASIESDRWVQSEQQLHREMYHYFKDDPRNRDRDWWRVAVTETRAAHNTGRLIGAQEQGFEYIYYIVQPDACETCRRAYLDAGGKPIIFEVGPLLERVIQTHGLNINPADKGKPNGALHPQCNCIPAPYVPGTEPLRPGAKR